MKATTLLKRLEKETKPDTCKGYPIKKNSTAYKLAMSAIQGQKIIRPCHTSGRGRYTSNLDYTSETETLLQLVGIKFESGNDAPRGGKCGNFIKILTPIDCTRTGLKFSGILKFVVSNPTQSRIELYKENKIYCTPLKIYFDNKQFPADSLKKYRNKNVNIVYDIDKHGTKMLQSIEKK